MAKILSQEEVSVILYILEENVNVDWDNFNLTKYINDNKDLLTGKNILLKKVAPQSSRAELDSNSNTDIIAENLLEDFVKKINSFS